MTRLKSCFSCASLISIQLVPVARITMRAGPLVTPNTWEGSVGALAAGTGGRPATSVGAGDALVDVSTRGCGTGGKGELATGVGVGAMGAGSDGGGGSELTGAG